MSIISDKLRKSAGHYDARCNLEIAGVCQWPNGGLVLCHIRLIGECGGGQKPDDTLATFGCNACHDVFDGRAPGLEKNSPDWLFYALRGMARTVRWWHQHDFLSIKGAK